MSRTFWIIIAVIAVITVALLLWSVVTGEEVVVT